MKSIYVAQDYGSGAYSLLHLDPYTDEQADRAIRWQGVGQGQFDRWVKLTKDHDNQTMLLDGEPVPSERGCYTEKAWSDFWERKI